MHRVVRAQKIVEQKEIGDDERLRLVYDRQDFVEDAVLVDASDPAGRGASDRRRTRRLRSAQRCETSVPAGIGFTTFHAPTPATPAMKASQRSGSHRLTQDACVGIGAAAASGSALIDRASRALALRLLLPRRAHRRIIIDSTVCATIVGNCVAACRYSVGLFAALLRQHPDAPAVVSTTRHAGQVTAARRY